MATGGNDNDDGNGATGYNNDGDDTMATAQRTWQWRDG
jgi:hypothetical protein